ncbi:hypothetical protein AK812_SmicGene10858 [Symbiodinium microadriaticum]|uniref:Uncharacterized protein n=1 Tax=Symbiodinium microadriaticum TaxID=2951 RepID=A0A1Q9EEV9_SYMMI|nr:hypothetical protein AK812_SmicGene10858 [Symbiodinium microadriaticum]
MLVRDEFEMCLLQDVRKLRLWRPPWCWRKPALRLAVWPVEVDRLGTESMLRHRASVLVKGIKHRTYGMRTDEADVRLMDSDPKYLENGSRVSSSGTLGHPEHSAGTSIDIL